MKRRTFVKNTAASATFVSIGGLQLSCKKKNTTKITILHTNDMHSHIDSFPENHSRHPGMGGMRRVASLVKKIRSEEKNICLLYTSPSPRDATLSRMPSSA